MSNLTPRTPPSWLQEAQAMRAKGASIRHTAKTVKAGWEAVRNWLERFPPESVAPRVETRPAPAWAEPAKRLRADGLSWGAVSVAVGAKTHTIRMVIDQAYHDRERAKKKRAGDRMREDLAPMPERPKASLAEVMASRFVKPGQRRHAR